MATITRLAAERNCYPAIGVTCNGSLDMYEFLENQGGYAQKSSPEDPEGIVRPTSDAAGTSAESTAEARNPFDQ